MSEKETAVVVKDLNKTFKLPHEQHSGIKQYIVNIFRKKQKGYELQHVLSDISFEVKQGEFFGIVGRNGSGKSTLLKLLAGIYAPDKGLIHVNGVIVPFIELGVGFNPELTGRENIFLNGALLGMSHDEVLAVYDDIVEFAELEKFMDQRLKNYSSGMQVRLAFSIAIRSSGNILLIDEVLAVGDAKFQDKCLKVFRRLKKEGKTIIFISHDMGMVKRFCDRVIMIKDGQLLVEGTAAKVAEYYEEANMPESQTVTELNKKMSRAKNKLITNMTMSNERGEDVTRFAPGETIRLTLTCDDAESRLKHCGVALYSADETYVYGTNTILDKQELSFDSPFTYVVDAPPHSGRYYFKIGMFGETDDEILEFYDHGPAFQVSGNTLWGGVVELNHGWEK